MCHGIWEAQSLTAPTASDVAERDARAINARHGDIAPSEIAIGEIAIGVLALFHMVAGVPLS